jgi:hypothetical protein
LFSNTSILIEVQISTELFVTGLAHIEKNEMGWTCSTYWDRRGEYRVLVEKPEGKRPLGRPRHGWRDNIKMDLQEVGCGVRTGLMWLKIGTGGGHL